mmetsp:Transcript_6466/g.9987  ORF Transcript_6466/g.9987 Transcript_6466/m.9987 type:complete len:212 (-) Transcript_6466:58-693(-)
MLKIQPILHLNHLQFTNLVFVNLCWHKVRKRKQLLMWPNCIKVCLHWSIRKCLTIDTHFEKPQNFLSTKNLINLNKFSFQFWHISKDLFLQKHWKSLKKSWYHWSKINLCQLNHLIYHSKIDWHCAFMFVDVHMLDLNNIQKQQQHFKVCLNFKVVLPMSHGSFHMHMLNLYRCFLTNKSLIKLHFILTKQKILNQVQQVHMTLISLFHLK